MRINIWMFIGYRNLFVMNIACAFYTLEAGHSLNAASSALKREGALLKVIFEPGLMGYADCHVWPELGDLPLKEQLKLLAQGQFTPITRCALEFAKVDAEARLEGKRVLANRPLPSSHFLISSFLDWTPEQVEHIMKQGYTHVKLKMGRYIELEIDCLHSLFLNSSLKLRLDFNETLTFSAFRHFLHRIQRLQDHIEFIEDPFPFQADEWASIQEEGWVLACDRQVLKACNLKESARVLVIKPALQSFCDWKKWVDQTCIVTSYLGHPLGQLAAAYASSQIDPSCSSVHGLLSHHVYQPTSFSWQLNWQSPKFMIPSGYGFGFDDDLENQEWVELT
jgi:O-succinylbenzoate synthase